MPARYIPKRLTIVECRVGYGFPIPEAIVGTSLIPKLIPYESMVIWIESSGHGIVIREGEAWVRRTKASR